jgi:hypothetical protein
MTKHITTIIPVATKWPKAIATLASGSNNKRCPAMADLGTPFHSRVFLISYSCGELLNSQKNVYAGENRPLLPLWQWVAAAE